MPSPTPDPDPTTGHAAPIGFVKMPGIKGESKAKGHEGEIEIMSMKLGTQHAVAASIKEKAAGQRTKIVVTDLSFKAVASCASPQLFVQSAYGKPFDTAVLTLVEPNDKESWVYMTITLTDVLISSYQVYVLNDKAEPVDEVSLSFSKIEYEMVAATPDHKPGASTVTTWDVATTK